MRLGALALATALTGAPAAAKPAFTRELPPPPDERTLETVVRSVAALAQAGGRLVFLPDGGSFGASAPFDASGATRAAAFGALTSQTHLPVAAGRWTGLALTGDRALLLEGEALAVAEADPQTLVEIARRTVPWDLVKPPRDRGGEPTAVETAALRARFKRALFATPGIRASGFAPLPAAWGAQGSHTYLVASRIPGFPLLMLECLADPESSCQITRQCLLEGAKDLAPADITGIATSAKRRQILIGDAKHGRLLAFHYDSCLHVPRVGEYALPPRLKTLENVAIDADDRLWVSTAAPDDFQNASLYDWSDW